MKGSSPQQAQESRTSRSEAEASLHDALSTLIETAEAVLWADLGDLDLSELFFVRGAVNGALVIIQDAQTSFELYGKDGMTMGQRVRQARIRKMLTLRRFARALGVDIRSVSRWENEGISPQKDALAKIARVLGVRKQWILSGTPNQAGE